MDEDVLSQIRGGAEDYLRICDQGQMATRELSRRDKIALHVCLVIRERLSPLEPSLRLAVEEKSFSIRDIYDISSPS